MDSMGWECFPPSVTLGFCDSLRGIRDRGQAQPPLFGGGSSTSKPSPELLGASAELSWEFGCGRAPPSPFPSCSAMKWMENCWELPPAKRSSSPSAAGAAQVNSLFPPLCIHGGKSFPGNPCPLPEVALGTVAGHHTLQALHGQGKQHMDSSACPGLGYREQGTAEAPRDPIHGARKFWIHREFLTRTPSSAKTLSPGDQERACIS